MEFFGKKLSGPFTIPSGIVTTAVPIMQYIFDHMPQVGVVTTKSIGLEPRAGTGGGGIPLRGLPHGTEPRRGAHVGRGICRK